jgi:hypothetical protein
MCEKKTKKRGFLVVGFLSLSLVAWLVQTVVGGFIYATAAFFTKQQWEKWKSKRQD